VSRVHVVRGSGKRRTDLTCVLPPCRSVSHPTAHERAAHASRLRTELSQSKFEQQDYLKKVERARVQKDKEEKRRQRAQKAGSTGTGGTAGVVGGDSASAGAPAKVVGPGGKTRTFKQRQPVSRDVRDQRDGASGGKKRAAPGEGGADERSGSKRSKGGESSALDGVLSKLL